MAVTDEAIEKINATITSGAPRAGGRLPREADEPDEAAGSWATAHDAGAGRWLAPVR